MQLLSYIPAPPLADFVELLWLCQGDAPAHARERVLPTGTTELVIGLGEDAWGPVICGAHSESFVIDTALRSAVMGVHFRPGGAFQARFTSGWDGPGRVDVCQPPRRLLVTLNPGQDDETVVEAEIIPDGERTRLVLEERGLPLNGAAGHGAGWQAHVEDLGAHLAGRPAADWRARWAELGPEYDDRLG